MNKLFWCYPSIGSNKANQQFQKQLVHLIQMTLKLVLVRLLAGAAWPKWGLLALFLTGPTTSPAGKAAIDRLQNQADREACNASGGFYTPGGACLTGKEAEEQVNKIIKQP